MKIIGCIPSRYASSRLPGKPLCDIAGKAMVLHVVEKAMQATRLDEVVVLTDDERILNTVIKAGYRAEMTSTECASGTDRIAEYMSLDSSGDIFVNIQGDEVILNPRHIDQLIDQFTGSGNAEMGTLAHWVDDAGTLSIPSAVKVVTGVSHQALYFSRNCIPVNQNGELPERALIHIGVYIYTRQTLEKLTSLAQTPLENIEKLEQLRALENGIDINVTIIEDHQSLAVDTPEDLLKARNLLTA